MVRTRSTRGLLFNHTGSLRTSACTREYVRVLLSNVINRYPGIATRYTERVGQPDEDTLTLREAVRRLKIAENARL